MFTSAGESGIVRGTIRPIGPQRRIGEIFLGSWGRTLALSLLLLVLLAGVVWLAVSGRIADLRHTSFPGHSYPPAGLRVNPLSGNPNDLIDAREADRVGSQVRRDISVESAAFATGDTSQLPTSDTSRSLQQLRQLVAQNNSQGIVQREDDRWDSIVVGKLPNPATSTVGWCVQARGQATVTDISKSTGQPTGMRRYRFDGKFWLVKVGAAYLITDSEVANQPISNG